MNTTHRTLAVGAVMLATGLGTAGQAHAVSDIFYLDAHEVQASGDIYAGPETTPHRVVPGVLTTIVVEGTISLWAKSNWANPRFEVCGTPRSSPQFASRAVTNGKVGVDAVGRFALIRKPGGACPTLPDKSGGNFQINSGSGFKTLRPLLSLGHLYTYLVLPTTNRISVRLYDPVAEDNYGQFKITVLPVL